MPVRAPPGRHVGPSRLTVCPDASFARLVHFDRPGSRLLRLHAGNSLYSSSPGFELYMSKRTLVLGLLVVVLGAIGYFGYGMLTESEAEQQAQTRQQSFPTGVLQTTGGGTFEFSSVPHDRPVVLMFFSPTCPYCQEETAEIVQHGKLPQDATILMVSTFARNDLQTYADQYGLGDFQNIRVLRDFGGSLFQQFGVQSVPYTIVYDSSHNYVRAFRGKADVNRLYAAVTSPESVQPGPAQ